MQQPIALHQEELTDLNIVINYLKEFLQKTANSVTLFKNPDTHLASKEPKIYYNIQELLDDLESKNGKRKKYVNVINFLWDMNHTMFANLQMYPLYNDKYGTKYSLVDLINILTFKIRNSK